MMIAVCMTFVTNVVLLVTTTQNERTYTKLVTTVRFTVVVAIMIVHVLVIRMECCKW